MWSSDEVPYSSFLHPYCQHFLILKMDNLEFFKTFFRIGLFTLGGGYAMIPIIEEEVVNKKHWIEKKDFLDIVAISQSCPGALAINMSAFIGYRLKKVPGAVVSSIATALPSFIIILLIAMFFHQFKNNAVVAAIFRGIRPAVVALIAVPTFTLAKDACITLNNCWVPIICILAIYMFGVSPIFVILLSGVCGYVYGQYIKPTE